MTTPTAPADRLSRIHLGSAPDSWGVWMPDDPRQTPWTRFLDEVERAGYAWMELGPFGYLPTEPARLIDETARRGLTITGGTVDGGLHRPGTFDEVLREEPARGPHPHGRRGALPRVPARDVPRRRRRRDVAPADRADGRAVGLAPHRDSTARASHPRRVRHDARCSIPMPTATSTPRSTWSASSRAPIPSLSSSAWTRATSPYCGGDNIAIIRKYPSASDTCTSSRSRRVMDRVNAGRVVVRPGRPARLDVRATLG